MFVVSKVCARGRQELEKLEKQARDAKKSLWWAVAALVFFTRHRCRRPISLSRRSYAARSKGCGSLRTSHSLCPLFVQSRLCLTTATPEHIVATMITKLSTMCDQGLTIFMLL